MATPNFAPAWKGTVSFNGTLFNALSFDWESSAASEDITYSQSGGATYQIMLAGYKKASGSVTFVYDAANQPQLSPSSLVEGSTVSMIAYPEGTKPYACTALVTSMKWSSGPQAGVSAKGTMSWTSTGAYTIPAS